MTQPRLSSIVPLALLLALGSRPAAGFAPAAPGSLSALARRLPLPAPSAAADAKALHALATEAARPLALESGGPWHVDLDPDSGRVRRALGTGIPLLPGHANSLPPRKAPPTPSELEAIGRSFIARHAALFNLDPGELAFDLAASRAVDPSGLVHVIQFGRVVGGVPVAYSQVQLVLNRGNLTYLGVTGFEPVAVSGAAPVLDETATWSMLVREATRVGVSVAGADRKPVSLVLVPTRAAPGAPVRHRLVRRHPFTLPGGFESWRASVDARSGELLELEDTNAYACTLDPTEVAGQVKGGVRLARADNAEVVRPLPFALVVDDGSNRVTDLNGNYSYSGRAAESGLQGAYFVQNCSGCTLPGSIPLGSAGMDGTLDFGTGGMDQIGNGKSTPADRTAHYQLNLGRLLATEWMTSPWLAGTVDSNVNVNQTCNAFFNGTSLNFFRSGRGCRNMGEIRNVLHHEWAHGLDEHDGQPVEDGALREAYGDTFAFLIDHDSCIGESVIDTGVFIPNYCTTIPDCTTLGSCDGSRNLDEVFAPDGVVTWSRVPMVCNPSVGCSGPQGTECHCEGAVFGQTMYHLALNLLTGNAYDTQTPLPPGNPALSDVAAWFVMERDFFGAAALMQSYAPSNRQSLGTSAYDAFMAVDDDDGNLANGTPHAAYIHQAFAHHEIDEPVAVGDAPDCVGPPDPVVTLSMDLDAFTGKPTVHVTFNDVSAAFYRVYRNIRVNDFWLPIAAQVLDDNRATYVVDDVGVPFGGTFNYAVVAVSSAFCPSPGANINTLTVALPDAAVAIGALTDPLPGGDADGIPEPGDVVELRLDLGEAAGLAGLVNASVTLQSRDPLATVVVGGPIAYGDVAAGMTVTGPSNFVVAIDNLASCGSSLPLLAEVTADNACALRALRIDLPTAGCVPRFCVPPTGFAIANRLLMARQGNDLVLSWAGGVVTPPRYVLLRSSSPLELADTPGGIGDETVVARVTTETATDVGALLDPSPAFYEVYGADSCGGAAFP